MHLQRVIKSRNPPKLPPQTLTYAAMARKSPLNSKAAHCFFHLPFCIWIRPSPLHVIYAQREGERLCLKVLFLPQQQWCLGSCSPGIKHVVTALFREYSCQNSRLLQSMHLFPLMPWPNSNCTPQHFKSHLLKHKSAKTSTLTLF